jgi:hypothetical protein
MSSVALIVIPHMIIIILINLRLINPLVLQPGFSIITIKRIFRILVILLGDRSREPGEAFCIKESSRKSISHKQYGSIS